MMNPNPMPQMLDQAVREHLTEKLRKKLMKEAETVVNEVVISLAGDLQTSVELYRDQVMMRDLLKVIVEDRRT